MKKPKSPPLAIAGISLTQLPPRDTYPSYSRGKKRDFCEGESNVGKLGRVPRK
jgi:hypothetical protein